MSWFQLDPESLAARAAGDTPRSTAADLALGALGFTVVSVAGFVPWGVLGGLIKPRFGEAGMYIACALVFVLLSGPVLHRLILGTGSLPRFNKLFAIAFTTYAVAWIAAWMVLRGHLGSAVGIGIGALAFCGIVVTAFGARQVFLRSFAVFLALNAIGYFAGGPIETALIRTHPVPAKLLWGVTFGLGFGAGLGYLFHAVQERARALMPHRP